MPDRLKSFELHGYKTFASRIEFVFTDGVTAIVGPNGSGKSNIADAIRWVLGEQSFGLLRAKKTEDMIFAGSEQRPRAGMASATIVFNNSDGWLPIDFTEVGITRRAYRDGNNEYLLNGQRVRLKDVSELLAKSGLAERTYTVIGQGLVDAALSLKAEERRRLFEEAAGIGLHRSRRDEALRRLDSTQRNLERVQDILAELQPRLRSLERQAKKSSEYDQVRLDLKNLLREWYGYHWYQVQSEVTKGVEIVRQQEDSLEKTRHDQAELDQQLASMRMTSQNLRNQISNYNHNLAVAYSHKESLIRELAVVEERSRSLDNQCELNLLEIKKYSEEVNLYNELVDNSSEEIDQLANEYHEAEQGRDQAEQDLNQIKEQIIAVDNEVQTAQKNLLDVSSQYSVVSSKLEEREAYIKLAEKNLEETKSHLVQVRDEKNEIQTSYQSTLSLNQDWGKKLNNIENELNSVKQEFAQLELTRRDTLEKKQVIEANVMKLRTQLEVLKQAEDNLSGYADGARILLQALRGEKIAGAKGALSNMIEVPDVYETAITSVLGEYIGALIVEDWAGIDKGLELLEKGSARGAILPLKNLSPTKPWKIDFDKIPSSKDTIIGIATEFIKARDELKPIIDLLLGQVLIVRDRNSAKSLLSNGIWPAYPTLKVVTLKGEIFYSNGPVLSAIGSEGILSRSRRKKDIEIRIGETEKEQRTIQEKLDSVSSDLEKISRRENELLNTFEVTQNAEKQSVVSLHKVELLADKANRAYEWQRELISKLEEEIRRAREEIIQLSSQLNLFNEQVISKRNDLQVKISAKEALPYDDKVSKASYWQTQAAVAERALKDAEMKKWERQEALSRAMKSVDGIKIRREEMLDEIQLLKVKQEDLVSQMAASTKEIEDIRAVLGPTEVEFEEAEKALSKWILKDSEARKQLSSAEHLYAQSRINLTRKQEALESLRRRIEDDFGLVSFDYVEAVSGPKPLPLDGWVEELPLVDQLSPDLDENVQRLKSLLRRMGPVNPEAQGEYQQVKDRYDFLTAQLTDLHKAESDIKTVIAELDVLMEREFRKTFDAVAQEFRQTFTRLFGGGSARLVLTDPDDMTGTGIDIEARLPGRREQGLALLSGGERSLTAVALVFSLLRISPTPFCILDEVDAMLDEANVGRFRELLEELSERTQFIIITHNRNTVQAASVIYGVTMGRDSASQVISLKLDQLTEEYGVQHE